MIFYGDYLCYVFAKKQGGAAAAKFKNFEVGAKVFFQGIQRQKIDPGQFVYHGVAAALEGITPSFFIGPDLLKVTKTAGEPKRLPGEEGP
jgi:hypothetical protein